MRSCCYLKELLLITLDPLYYFDVLFLSTLMLNILSMNSYRPPLTHREVHDLVASELKLQLDRHSLIEKIVSK